MARPRPSPNAARGGGDERGPCPRATKDPRGFGQRDLHQERPGAVSPGRLGQEPGVREGAHQAAGTCPTHFLVLTH